MLLRLLNLSLLLAALVGAALAFAEQRRVAAIAGEHQRLTGLVGNLSVEDETKIHVLAIDTGEPMHFLWRIFVPANVDLRWQFKTIGGSSSSWGGGDPEPTEMFLRYRMKVEDNWVNVFHSTNNSSGLSSLGGRKAPSLVERPDLIEVQIAGADEVAVFEPDEVVDLLSLRCRPDAQEQLDEPELWKWLDVEKPLATVRVGSKDAWAKAGGGP